MYVVNELSTLIPDPNKPGNFLGWSWPNAINDKGMIVGQAETAQGNTHAVLWQGQSIQDLGTLDPDPNNPGQFLGDSSAFDINNSGTIVGFSSHDNLRRAFVWRNGRMTELKPAPGFTNASAYGINNQGSAVGSCDGDQLDSQACMWDPSGVINVLGIPPPHAGFAGRWSIAVGINDKNEVIVLAGDYLGTPTNLAPYLWRGGIWIPLFNSPAELNGAKAINNRSEVVGSGFRWDPNTGRHNLNAIANAISELDLIVGDVAGVNFRTAVLIGFNGGTIDLNTLIPANPNWYLLFARGVNSDGWIIGSGRRDGRQQRGFVLLPEPQFGVDINTVAVVTKVLGGVAAGGGGIGIQLGNPIPFPIPPWGPEFRLPPDFERLPVMAQDVAAASGLLAVAQTIRDPDARARITEIAGQLAGDRIKLLDAKG